ncbi:hypothetical protein [Nocardioides pacificus]
MPKRLAWLLAVSRILSPDERMSRREFFLERLHEQGVASDASRLSRWESGNQPIADSVVVAYEGALDLPSGALLAVARGLQRALGTEAAARRTPPSLAGAEDDLDKLIGIVEVGGASGGDWLSLAVELSRYDRVYLPERSWMDLSASLVADLTRSVGASYVRRYEAASLLMAHPVARRYMLRALGEHLMHPDVQVVIPTLNLLQEIEDKAASDLVLRLMTSEHRVLSSGAQSVAAGKLARHHFSPEETQILVRHAIHSLRTTSGGSGGRRGLDAIDLAVQLPLDSFQRVRQSLKDPRMVQSLEWARDSGELVPVDVARTVARGLATAVQAETPAPHAAEPDPMLQQLIREALFHSRKTRRIQAGLLLAASPYAASVAHCCLQLAQDPNDFVAARAWGVLALVGHGRRRTEVAELALTESRAPVQSRALLTLGMSPVTLDPQEATSIAHCARVTDIPAIRHSAMFAVGMSGSNALDELATCDSEWHRRAASWWRMLGPALHDPETLPA